MPRHAFVIFAGRTRYQVQRVMPFDPSILQLFITFLLISPSLSFLQQTRVTVPTFAVELMIIPFLLISLLLPVSFIDRLSTDRANRPLIVAFHVFVTSFRRSLSRYRPQTPPDDDLYLQFRRFRRNWRSRVQDARGFFFMLIVFVLGSVLVSSVFLSWLWFFLLFLLLSFSCFFLYGLSSIFFSFWFFFLEFFLLCVRFPLSLFSYEKCFCAHVQTWPRRYRDHADHEPDDPGPGWEVRNEDSISARLSLRAVWTIRVRMRRLNSGLSVWRGLEPISKVMPRLRYRLVVCLSSLMDTACDQWSIRDHFGSGPIYRHVIRMPISVRLIWVN